MRFEKRKHFFELELLMFTFTEKIKQYINLENRDIKNILIKEVEDAIIGL